VLTVPAMSELPLRLTPTSEYYRFAICSLRGRDRAQKRRRGQAVRVILSQRIALVPTATQEILLRQAVGVSRFSYNWALTRRQRQYQAGQKPNEGALRRQLNSIKRQHYPWMLLVPKSVHPAGLAPPDHEASARVRGSGHRGLERARHAGES